MSNGSEVIGVSIGALIMRKFWSFQGAMLILMIISLVVIFITSFYLPGGLFFSQSNDAVAETETMISHQDIEHVQTIKSGGK